MSYYRRNQQAGATYFFTLCLRDRKSRILVDYIDVLRLAYRKTQRKKPFITEAIVILPDHIHALWTMPTEDDDYPSRVRLFKSHFTRQLPVVMKQTDNKNRQTHKQTGIWQLRYWEHTIRDEYDFINHANYIHYNPIKHGYVKNVADWKYSTFHRYVKKGLYEKDWGSGIEEIVGEFGE